MPFLSQGRRRSTFFSHDSPTERGTSERVAHPALVATFHQSVDCIHVIPTKPNFYKFCPLYKHTHSPSKYTLVDSVTIVHLSNSIQQTGVLRFRFLRLSGLESTVLGQFLGFRIQIILPKKSQVVSWFPLVRNFR